MGFSEVGRQGEEMLIGVIAEAPHPECGAVWCQCNCSAVVKFKPPVAAQVYDSKLVQSDPVHRLTE